MGNMGAWRAWKFTDDSGVRVCPMCGNFEDEFHILRGSENLESWRNQMFPESFLHSRRGGLACWELMVNPDNWLKLHRQISGQSTENSNLALRLTGNN